MTGPRLAAGAGVTLPLVYLALAAAALVLATGSLPWLADALAGHYYHPRLLALTHLVALGWVTLAIMGASYQLLPVVLEQPLWSTRLARWQLAWLLPGIGGMVGHFATGRWTGLLWAAGLVGLGVLTHLVNVALTLRALRRWEFTARCVAGAHVGLALTVAFGLVLAAARVWGLALGDGFPALHAHAHLAVLGWVSPMVLGVAARAYPMFLLGEGPTPAVARLQELGLLLGAPAVVAGLLWWPALRAAGVLAVTTALGAHAWWLLTLARRRKRPALDWGLRFLLTGGLWLPAAGGVGLGLAAGWLAGPRAALVYAVLGLGGWVSLTIVGMMLKIVPFLVWYRVYAPRVGREPVPALGALSSPALEAAAYVLLGGGLLALTTAVARGAAGWIAGAGWLLAAGALAFAGNQARILARLRQARHQRPATPAAVGVP